MPSGIEKSFDRATVRKIVEDHLRAVFSLRIQHPFGRLPSRKTKLIDEMHKRFDDQMAAWCDALPPDQAKELDRMFAEELRLGATEWKRDPVDYASQLGILPGGRVSHRQGIGEMAVRTAVRASIWEGIRRLFWR